MNQQEVNVPEMHQVNIQFSPKSSTTIKWYTVIRVPKPLAEQLQSRLESENTAEGKNLTIKRFILFILRESDVDHDDFKFRCHSIHTSQSELRIASGASPVVANYNNFKIIDQVPANAEKIVNEFNVPAGVEFTAPRKRRRSEAPQNAATRVHEAATEPFAASGDHRGTSSPQCRADTEDGDEVSDDDLVVLRDSDDDESSDGEGTRDDDDATGGDGIGEADVERNLDRVPDYESRCGPLGAVLRGFGEPSVQFVIPYFQRPYRWDAARAGKLLEDIIAHMDSHSDDSSYFFLGNVFLRSTSDGGIGQATLFDILDGQQRMTTLMIILAAIRHRASQLHDNAPEAQKRALESLVNQVRDLLVTVEYGQAGEENVRPRLLVRPSDATFFNRWITSVENEFVEALTAQEGNEELDGARLCVHLVATKIHTVLLRDGKFGTYVQLKQLLEHLLKRCAIGATVLCGLVSDEQSRVFFLSINDTALQLSEADKLKVYLLTSVQDVEERDAFMNEWEFLDDKLRAYKRMAPSGGATGHTWRDGFDNLLFCYMQIEQALEHDETSVSWQRYMYESMRMQDKSMKVSNASPLLVQITRRGRAYYAFLTGDIHLASTDAALIVLLKSDAMEALTSECNVLLCILGKFTPSLLKCCFHGVVIHIIDRAVRHSSLQDGLDILRRTLRVLIACLLSFMFSSRQVADKRVRTKVYGEMIRCIGRGGPEAEAGEPPELDAARLSDLFNPKLNGQRLSSRWERVQNRLRGMGVSLQQHDKVKCLMLLHEVTLQYESARQEPRPHVRVHRWLSQFPFQLLGNGRGSFRVDLDHIFPQRPLPEYWSHWADTSENTQLRNRMGNLVILPRDANIRASNYGYLERKRLMEDFNEENSSQTFLGFLRTDRHLTREERRDGKWTPQAVEKRQTALLEFVSHLIEHSTEHIGAPPR